MRFNDLAHQGKTQTRAPVAASGGTIQLVEGFKDIIQAVGGNSNPVSVTETMTRFSPSRLTVTTTRPPEGVNLIPLSRSWFNTQADFLRICLHVRHIFIDNDVQAHAAFLGFGGAGFEGRD